MKALYLKLIGVLFLIVIGFNNTSFAQNPPSSEAVNMTYEQAMAMKKPVVVDFYADWCGACKRFSPILNDVKTEYSSKFNFVCVNADKPENTAITSKYNITSLPSVFIVDPKTGKSKFINQDYYFNPARFKKELDDYLKSRTD